jgi:2-succinyl-5-enolpyruvyl-6-hydroxy-3-cyclohexene-1-carboxylate synthase
VSEGDVALACARTLVEALAMNGLTDVSISPGSRSTPIALAFARDDRVRVYVHLDERAAAFFALGLAKATERPVAIVTTSGTATANLFPAVVEAWMSRVPLIVLTADRPPEVRGRGANQTIDQVELFGRYVRWFVDAPLPSEGPRVSRVWLELADETYRRACRGPGPVHVNLPFREPLVPAGDPVDLGGPVALALPGTWPTDGPRPTDDDVEGFVDAIAGVERGLLYVGGLRCPSRAVLELGERLGWPMAAEPMSGLRAAETLTAGQFLMSNERFVRAHMPDVVVQFGAAPTSRAALAFVRDVPRLVIVDPDEVIADPHRRATRRFVVAAGAIAHEAARRLGTRADDEWLDEWRDADERARRAVDTMIDTWDEPYEGRIARDVAAFAPEDSVLVVGSSMPVRDLDAYMAPRTGLRVIANRGASGIDGFVSTVLGVAATGAPTTALLGDLTLLHDIGSLVWSAGRGHDVVLVVANNNGGVIFSFLEQRELTEFEELFATPHGLDLRALCLAAGAGHTRVERAGDLVPAIGQARSAGGVHVIEVVVDAQLNVRRHAEAHTAVAKALELERD